jgi:hypothetical protein
MACAMRFPAEAKVAECNVHPAFHDTSPQSLKSVVHDINL